MCILLIIGVRYAKAPTGDLRFEKPRPADVWSGVRDALNLGSVCPQMSLTTGIFEILSPVVSWFSLDILFAYAYAYCILFTYAYAYCILFAYSVLLLCDLRLNAYGISCQFAKFLSRCR